MANSPSTALAVDFQPLPREILSRASNTVGIVLLTVMAGILMFAAEMPANWRTGIGLLVAAAIIATGDLMTRRSDSDYAWWSGTGLIGCGYALALIMAHSSYYVIGAPALDQPYAAWLLKLGIVGAATLHVSHHSVLRWLVMPTTMAVSGHVLLTALASHGNVTLFGTTVTVPAIAIVLGMLWFSLLSLAHKQKQSHSTSNGAADKTTVLLYKTGDLVYFLLSVACAVFLPKYLGSFDYAPVWWSIEMPLLLAVCWRSKTFGKHLLIMLCWAASAGLMFTSHLSLDLVWYMFVPGSGVAMGLAYRVLEPQYTRNQKLLGYCGYVYGAAAVALALPYLKLGMVGAMPFWLFEAGMLLVLGIALRDRLLHMIALGVSFAALAVYGSHRHDWMLWLMFAVIAGCYGMCFLYRYILTQGGWQQAGFAPLRGKFVIGAKEARWLEFAAATAGYATWMTGSYILMSSPTGIVEMLSVDFLVDMATSNTLLWYCAGFAMVYYGLMHDRLEHRFFGVGSWSAATLKLWYLDLAQAHGVAPNVISLCLGGICFVGLGRLCIVAYNKWEESNSSNDDPPNSGGPDDKV